jgi:XTP/dITP diphosphohydrolase
MEKKTLVLASNNAHKLEEIRAVLGGMYDIKGLKDIGCHDDIPETGNTFEANALQKALYVKEHFGLDCFADDSGLQVEALNGEPGVYSARYAAKNGKSAGENKDDDNMDTLLEKLSAIPPVTITDGPLAGTQGWKACFRTCIALVQEGEKNYFDGIVNGHIICEKRGNGGFGYDPIFVPEGYGKTFAELGTEVKNGISHRALAVAKLAEFLKKEK